MDYAAQAFSYGAQALEYVLPVAIPALLVYQDRQDFIALSRPVDAHTDRFVKDQLRVGYPELANTEIKVVKIPNSCFAAALYNDTAYISVPEHMCQAELTLAQNLQDRNTKRHTPEQLIAIAQQNNLAVNEFITNAKKSGFAVDATSLKNWQGTLLHEGSHLLHKDSRTRIALLAASVVVGLYATEKVKNYLDVGSIAVDPTATNLILKGLAHIPSMVAKISVTALMNATWTYWQEYRADQDSIARTSDARILQARAQFFSESPKDDNALAHLMDHITNPHPSHQARAEYFEAAAQKLEKEA